MREGRESDDEKVEIVWYEAGGCVRQNFHQNTTPFVIVAFISILTIFIKLPIAIFLVHDHVHGQPEAMEVALVGLHFLFILIAVLCAVIVCVNAFKDMTPFGQGWLQTAQVATGPAFCLSLAMALANVMGLLVNLLYHDEALATVYFLHDGSSTALWIMVVMVTPLLSAVVFTGLPAHLLCVVWGISLTGLALCVALEHDKTSSVCLLVAYGLQSGLLLCCSYQRSVSSAALFRVSLEEEKHKSQGVISAHDKTLKGMLGNVAHDLKTPLSSFMTGVEIIAQQVTSCKELLDSRDLVLAQDVLTSADDCLSNIRSTNSFMVMTINRVLDYTKTCQGKKLVPNYDTVNLMETLRLPLNCMKDIQNRIEIVLRKLPRDICSHIITDKQWLQENVLCLLSNAVKYSASGRITVTVQLDTADSAPPAGSGIPATARSGCADDSNVAFSVYSKGSSSTRTVSDFMKWSWNKVTPYESASTHMSCHTLANIGGAKESNSTSFAARSMLRFEVMDEGIGMTEDAMKTLFNAFHQAQRLAGGTGLGLFSLANRLQALKGSCGVEKRRDGKQGSVFWFTIPYRPDAQAAEMKMSSVIFLQRITSHESMETMHPNELLCSSQDTAAPDFQEIVRVLSCQPPWQQPPASSGLSTTIMTATPPNSPCGTAHSASKGRILVVDDSPSIVKMTTMMLKTQGYEVTVAENGAVALDTIEKVLKERADGAQIAVTPAFDAILMDLQMPVMDGLEATRRLRSWEHNGITPKGVLLSSDVTHAVIGLSANCDDEILHETEQIGFSGFIVKPFSITVLQQFIATCRTSNIA